MPANKLSEVERAQIIDLVTSAEFPRVQGSGELIALSSAELIR